MTGPEKKREELLEEISACREKIKILERLEAKSVKEEEYEAITFMGIMDNLMEGILIFDTQERLTLLNTRAKEILGISLTEDVASELVVTSVKDLHLENVFEKACDQKCQIRKELMVPDGKGKQKIIRCRVSPIQNSKGKIYGIIAVLMDASEEEETERIKREFMSKISHELRSPLTSIREAISLVDDGLLGEITESQKKFLLMGIKDIDRLDRMINELVSMSKIESGRLEIKKELIDIVPVFEKVIEKISRKNKNKKVSIVTEFSKSSIEAYIDEGKIKQVMEHLIENAIDFTEEGTVRISAAENPDYIEVVVSDTGKGMSREELDTLFDKLEHFGKAKPNREKRTGLGLSIVKGIIDLHQGNIWCDSGEGEGTKVSYTVPKYNTERFLQEVLKEKIKTAREQYKEILIIIFKFKEFQDIKNSLGEEQAGEIVQEIIKLFKKNLRWEDFVGIKGEDTIVVAVKTERGNQATIEKKLKKKVKDYIFSTKDSLRVNFSYGAAIYPDDGGNVDELIETALEMQIDEKEERLKKCVMIVDDNPDIVKMVKRVLQVGGYKRFLEAKDGKEALEKLKTSVPDLIILDMKMPGMNGYELIGRLKENAITNMLPILVMSGFETEIDKLKENKEQKVIPTITKPVDIEALKKWVDYLL